MTAPAVLLEWSPTAPARVSRRRRTRRRLTVIFALFALSVIAAPAAALASVVRWAGVDDRTPTDAVIVLGAAQYQGVPSPVLANRLNHARELLNEGVSKQIITVGGFQTGDITSEAIVGKEELVAEGLRRRQVIAIPFGQDTEESLQAVATIAAEQGLKSVTLVSDPAHMARSRQLAIAAGLNPRVSPTHTGAGTQLTSEYLLRETVGLMYVWFSAL
jgi:uncharacterized SAM-binding protein YcdF (DUF218 family)